MAINGFHDSISERQRLLLALVVEHYIANAEAIGSRALMEIMNNAVSSATIRNELSELARKGYLEQPHTSAGRVPTLSGYRFYIDNLMHSQTLTPLERGLADQKISAIKAGSMEDYVKKACEALTELTNCAAVASSPDINARVQRVEYFPMSVTSGVAAILTSSGMIKSRIANTEEPVSTAMLYRFLQMANAQLSGKSPQEISHWDFSIIAQATGTYAQLFTPVMEAIAELITEARQTEVYFSGQRHLVDALGAESSADVIKLLTEEESLRELLKEAPDTPAVIMGEETGREELDCVSFILAPYDCKGFTAGRIGVAVNPRADYSRLLPLIDYFARRLGAMMS